jgi:hypothetical protein
MEKNKKLFLKKKKYKNKIKKFDQIIFKKKNFVDKLLSICVIFFSLTIEKR